MNFQLSVCQKHSPIRKKLNIDRLYSLEQLKVDQNIEQKV